MAGYYEDIAVVAFPTPSDDSYRIHDIRFKAGFETKSTPYDTELGIPPLPISFPALPSECRIDRDAIRDLTADFRNDRLSWTFRPGSGRCSGSGTPQPARTTTPPRCPAAASSATR